MSVPSQEEALSAWRERLRAGQLFAKVLFCKFGRYRSALTRTAQAKRRDESDSHGCDLFSCAVNHVEEEWQKVAKMHAREATEDGTIETIIDGKVAESA